MPEARTAASSDAPAGGDFIRSAGAGAGAVIIANLRLIVRDATKRRNHHPGGVRARR